MVVDNDLPRIGTYMTHSSSLATSPNCLSLLKDAWYTLGYYLSKSNPIALGCNRTSLYNFDRENSFLSEIDFIVSAFS